MLNKSQIEEIIAKYEDDYELFGIRFEDKERQEGEEVTDCSRNNIDREDEREFPNFGTDEYNEMDEMDGISTWDVKANVNKWLWTADQFIGKRAYLIAGNSVGDEQLNGLIDEGELLISDGVVIAKLY